MKAQDLRIGNYINRHQSIVSVWMLAQGDGGTINGVNEDEYKPIPLTEEWLLKFGFVCHPWGWVNEQIGIRLTLHSFIYKNDNGANIKIKHVHQLQNLFFALTGEELTLKA